MWSLLALLLELPLVLELPVVVLVSFEVDVNDLDASSVLVVTASLPSFAEAAVSLLAAAKAAALVDAVELDATLFSEETMPRAGVGLGASLLLLAAAGGAASLLPLLLFVVPSLLLVRPLEPAASWLGFNSSDMMLLVRTAGECDGREGSIENVIIICLWNCQFRCTMMMAIDGIVMPR